VDLRLELITVPVLDVDRAKVFYVERVGFTVEQNYRVDEGHRFVALTPPGLPCSIALTQGYVDFRAWLAGGAGQRWRCRRGPRVPGRARRGGLRRGSTRGGASASSLRPGRQRLVGARAARPGLRLGGRLALLGCLVSRSAIETTLRTESSKADLAERSLRQSAALR